MNTKNYDLNKLGELLAAKRAEESNEIRVRLTFIEPVLGGRPTRADLLADYIASKAPDAATIEQEVAARGKDDVVEDRRTIFEKFEDGTPYIFDYHVRGFFKGAMEALKRSAKGGKNTECAKIKAHKKEVDQVVMVYPRYIKLELNGLKVDHLSRPLRADTAQGPRVAIADSDMCPDGTTCEFTVRLLNPSMKKAIIECLDYGIYSGIGQWRSGGYGRFLWERLDGNGNTIGGTLPEAMELAEKAWK